MDPNTQIIALARQIYAARLAKESVNAPIDRRDAANSAIADAERFFEAVNAHQAFNPNALAGASRVRDQ